ncbi:MAG: helix-turn-helix domain-containing protein [Alphaproteobacteria bacterium]|nr:helix-turn-helix domain-containing protein [Alphaproteobacteria bacterium]
MLSRQFYTVKDVADLLKIGETTVRHWIRDRELRAIDVGREWRIAPVDLEDFLSRHATAEDPRKPQAAQVNGRTRRTYQKSQNRGPDSAR